MATTKPASNGPSGAHAASEAQRRADAPAATNAASQPANDAKKPTEKPAVSRDSLPLLKRLWADHVRHHWRTLILILIAIAIIAGTTSLYPLLITFAFDWFSEKNTLAITTLPWLVAVVTLLKGLSLYAQVTLTARVATRVGADMQGRLYDHLVEADIARLSRESAAGLSQRFLTDFRFVEQMLTRAATTLVRDVLTIIGLLAAMLWLDWQLTLVALAILPLAIFPVIRIGKKLRQVARTHQEQAGVMASLTSESFGAARVVKAYGLEGYLSRRARNSFELMRRLQLKAVVNKGRMEPILEALAGITIAIVLTLVGWRIMAGTATIGEFSGFLAALLVASQPIRALSNLNAVMQEGIAALKRYYDVIDEPPLVTERADARTVRTTRGEIAFEGVSFDYADGSEALKEVSFLAEAGRTTAFVGRSGAGKSTVFNLIPRLYDVTGGAVRVDGIDIRDMTLRSLRSAIAVVNQDVMLFDDTVAANIALGRMGAGREDIEAAARLAAADDFVKRLPDGYDTMVGDRGTRLSGGERQRIALARAFLKDAPILLLDEATSALDAENERAIQAALARLSEGRTTLVIAHRLATIRAADRIVVLDGGRVAEVGDHAALMAENGLYARFNALQFGTGNDDVAESPAASSA